MPDVRMDKLEQERDALRDSVRDLLTIVGWLMPGIGGVCIPDHKLLNNALVKARAILGEEGE